MNGISALIKETEESSLASYSMCYSERTTIYKPKIALHQTPNLLAS